MNARVLQLIDTMIELYGLTERTAALMVDIGCFSEYKKGEQVVSQGRSDNSEYFIIKGILREYLITEEGVEVTLNFYNKGIITPNSFRTKGGLSLISLQALTPSEILVTNTNELNELRQRNKEVFSSSSAILAKLFQDKITNQINHASQSATQRLKHFRREFPDLESTVPNNYIASYLGITNVSLSRLRKNLKKQ